MSPLRAKDVTFSTGNQADQTMVLDLDSTSARPRLPLASEEPTLVLDLTATQVRALLDDSEDDTDANR